MSTERTEQEIIEMLPQFALGVLEPEEMLVVDDYLQQHPELQRYLEQVEDAIGLLAYATPDVPLPVDAKAQLLQRIQQPGVLPAEASLPRPTIVLPSTVTQPLTSTPTKRQPIWAILSRPAVRWTAAFAIILGLLFWNIQLQRQLQATQEVISAMVQPSRTAIMVSTSAAPDAVGELFLLPDGRGVLRISGLPVPTTDAVYQFWFARPDNSRDSAGVFEVGAQGNALINIMVPGALEQYNQIWVTREPRGGSVKPTPPHFLEGPL